MKEPEEAHPGSSDPALAYLSLGSNLGDSRVLLAAAVDGLDRLPQTRVVARSSLYRTAPVGFCQQPDFLNQVVALHTGLSPHGLLAAAQELEQHAERVRGVRWGPRTLDVDLLWYDGHHLRDDQLELPHPRLEHRRFVLEPLAELAPDLVLESGRTVSEALAGVMEQDVERLTREDADTQPERG